jgi:tetratricopeptide (TPR) repeat protein
MAIRSTSSIGALLACALLPCAASAQDAAQTPQPAAPTTSADGRALSGLTAAQLFDIADQALAAGRNEDAEAIYKAVSADPKIEVRSEARFRLGMMYADQKRLTDAAVTFRALLDEQPNASRVRLELARVLAAMGNEGQARQQIRQAQAGGLPPDVAQVVDRFAAALRSNRTFGGSFEAAFAPDSNINRATDAKTLDTVIAPLTLSDDARAQSGIGAHLTGQVYARLRLGDQLNLVPRLSGDGTFYKSSQFNDLSGSALLGLEWQVAPGDRLTPSAGFTWRTYGGAPYARTINADLRWTHRTGRRSQLDTSLSYGNSSYSRNALQDGNLYNLGVTLERALTARTGIAVSATAMRQTAQDRGYSTASGGLSLVGWRDLGKTTLFANVTARRLESDAAVALFGARRKEWYLRSGLGATFRQIQVAGFSPVARVAYERNFSTVGLYDYRRVNVDFGITRAF